MRFVPSILFIVCALAVCRAPAKILEWKMRLDTNQRFVNDTGFSLKNQNKVAATDTLKLTLACVKPGDCPQVEGYSTNGMKDTIKLERKLDSARNVAVFSIPVSELPKDKSWIFFAMNGKDINQKISLSQTQQRAGNETGGKATDSIALETVGGAERLTFKGPFYSRKENTAVFVVSPYGNVFHRPELPIDEDDMVTVIIIGEKSLLNTLVIKRKSGFRSIAEIRIAGSETTVPKIDLQAGASPELGKVIVKLADFAPGRGEVEISKSTSEGLVSIGEFDFNVDPLYSGSFAFGGIYSMDIGGGKYGIAVANNDSIITRKERSAPSIQYVLTYTPFIWGKRDFEKPESWVYLNPMVGLVLEDIQNNALVGGSLDFFNNSFAVVAGVHIAKVTKLDPRANLKEGSSFKRPGNEIPTVNEWENGWFIGATIDLRAAVQFFKATVASAGK